MKTYIQSSTKCRNIFSINMIYNPMFHSWRSKNRSVFLRPCFKNRGCDEGLTHQILYNLICPLYLQFLLDIFRNSVSKQISGRKIYTPTTTTTTTCVVCSGAENNQTHTRRRRRKQQNEGPCAQHPEGASPSAACLENDCFMFVVDQQQRRVYSL